MIRSSSGERCGLRLVGETGAWVRIWVKITAVVGPSKGRRLVAVSYNTAPKLNRSVRASTSSPRACYGDMYATVPIAVPGVVSCSGSIDAVGVS